MVETYKCKGCGAPIEFSGNDGELVCMYCGAHMTIAELRDRGEKYDSTVEVDGDVKEQSIDVDGYKCQSCGAELIVDGDTTATVCAFCGSSAIIRERLSGESMPAKIIPFSYGREQAKEQFRRWCKKGILTPTQFKKNTFVESMTGMYVPFWLYDYDAGCHMNAHATQVSHHREGDYEVTTTRHFKVVRDANATFTLVPADASEKMPDDMMDLLEPFDYSKLKDFEMPYLSGFTSEKYTYNSEQMAQRVENRVRTYIFSETRNTINGYSSVNIENSNVRLRRKNAVYTLLPVWMISYRYKGENHILAINGETGKQVGTLPIAKEKLLAWFGGVAVGTFAILMMIGGFFG